MNREGDLNADYDFIVTCLQLFVLGNDAGRCREVIGIQAVMISFKRDQHSLDCFRDRDG